jgi:hypothetical protein
MDIARPRTIAVILAAIIRAGLLAVVLASLLLPEYGPQGEWPMAWTSVVFVVVSCAVPAWIALQPKGDGGG